MWENVQVPNKKGEMLYSKQLGEKGIKHTFAMEKFFADCSV
jgi:hypothetical protein